MILYVDVWGCMRVGEGHGSMQTCIRLIIIDHPYIVHSVF